MKPGCGVVLATLTHVNARQGVAAEATPEQLLVALYPVNFEKPFAEAIDGTSAVRNGTPPGSTGHGRETRMADVAADKRLIQVYKARVDRWKDMEMQDLAATAYDSVDSESVFTYAGTLIPVSVSLDWFRIRLSDQPGGQWAVVGRTRKPRHGHDAATRCLDAYANPLVLITNRPVHTAEDAVQVYQDWHQRPAIEHLYRLIQQDSLELEKIQLQALEVFRREFVLILAVAVFVLRLPHARVLAVLTGIRQLASATTSTDYDRRRFYLFLDGVQRTRGACSLLDWRVNAYRLASACPT